MKFEAQVKMSYVPWSCLSSTLVFDPSAFSCVVFLDFELNAPDRAPKRFKFKPAEALALE
jgi:hypothetical protein